MRIKEVIWIINKMPEIGKEVLKLVGIIRNTILWLILMVCIITNHILIGLGILIILGLIKIIENERKYICYTNPDGTYKVVKRVRK